MSNFFSHPTHNTPDTETGLADFMTWHVSGRTMLYKSRWWKRLFVFKRFPVTCRCVSAHESCVLMCKPPAWFMCLWVNVCHTEPCAEQQTQPEQTAFSPPPLAVNSLHSQDLRAVRNESAQCKCAMFPLLSAAQRFAVPFKMCVWPLSVWLLFLVP